MKFMWSDSELYYNFMKNITWPELPLEKWADTYDLLHLLFQVIGKIKLQFVPFKNHWWNIVFYPTVSGFSTGIIPYEEKCLQIDFDFHSHRIYFKFSSGETESIELRSGNIKSYYNLIKEILIKFDCRTDIWTVPVEMEYRTPFDKDEIHRVYDPAYAEKFQQIILKTSKVMEVFRSGFSGKASPVHFFWGSFDLAVTFFSGRPAPKHGGALNVGKEVMEKAYNAELASFGFWPGKGFGEPAFYAYNYPEPAGYKDYKVKPEAAFYYSGAGEFLLPYHAIQKSDKPEDAILDFFRSCYKAAEENGDWDKNLSSY